MKREASSMMARNHSLVLSSFQSICHKLMLCITEKTLQNRDVFSCNSTPALLYQFDTKNEAYFYERLLNLQNFS
jgi:hypothetical protein